MKILVIAALAAVLVGCASPEELARRQQMEQEQIAQQRAQYRENLARRCDGFGFSRGTEGHANCMMQLSAQDRAADDAYGAQLLQAYSMQQPTQIAPAQFHPIQRSQPAYRTTNCYSYNNGGMRTMNCTTN
jgi:hypothetical protein